MGDVAAADNPVTVVRVVVERVTRLCEVLACDPGLRPMLAAQGVTEERWQALVAAVVAGDEAAARVVLDELERAAAAGGVDGLTIATLRRYRQLPRTGSAPLVESGWSRCPHPRPCSRVHHTGDEMPAVCALSGAAFTPVPIIAR